MMSIFLPQFCGVLDTVSRTPLALDNPVTSEVADNYTRHLERSRDVRMPAEIRDTLHQEYIHP